MTDVFTLLSLPSTSKGFTAHRYAVVDEGSASSLPRKTPRLDTDSDSGSASRSQDRGKGKSVDKDGPLIIQINDFVGKVLDKTSDQSLATLKHCLMISLEKETKDILPTTYEGIYNCCYTVVSGGQGQVLYDILVMEFERCCWNLRKELMASKNDLASIEWLDRFVKVCVWFEGQVTLLRALLAYLDRAFILKNPRLSNIHDIAFMTFKSHVLDDSLIIEHIRTGIRDWIVLERNNSMESPHRGCIQNLVSHLVTHGTYTIIFERFVTEQTLVYYSEEAERKIHKMNITPELFLTHVTQRVAEEEARAVVVCQPATVLLVQHATRRGLLEGRLDWLAHGAMEPLMTVDGLHVLSKEFKAYVQRAVSNIIKDVQHDDTMIERLLEFKAFSDRALQTAFIDPKTQQPNKDFSYALTDAFALGFKARRNKPAELIAKHLDRLMRRGQRDMSDSDFDALLDSVLGLYRYTDDKDVFRTFYHRALARRLLLERSASDDFEKAMLKKLKEMYDPEFGMGDHMFNDLALSRDILREYRNRLPDDNSMHLSVMVLQRSVWPFAARKKDVDLLPWMQSELEAFGAFYKSKHQGRKLDWDHSLGTATLKARFTAGTKELTVSLYQAVVLLLFNDIAEMGYNQILEATRMEVGELKRTLQSLACGQKRVLRKHPVGKDIDEADTFYFNTDFTDPRTKVHINSIQAKETPEESKRTQTHIDSDRKHYLDAAIVRIMKAKKELSYEQLKTQTIEAVKNHFVPEVIVIKQRIAGLVEQEYLRRDEDDMNKYIYVA
ncbi:Cullin family-domain-containing protein [Scleroderma citrinum]